MRIDAAPSLALIGLVALLVAMSLPGRAAADNFMDEPRPAVRLGLGPQFATDPSSTMLTGQTLVGIDLPIADPIGVAFELGYSGERRGRLDGRHFVIGGALRYGGVLGLGALVHGIIGRTRGMPLVPTRRSGGIRVGGRVDVGRVAGVDIQDEYRSIASWGAESGFRMVFWFDALFALKVAEAT